MIEDFYEYGKIFDNFDGYNRFREKAQRPGEFFIIEGRRAVVCHAKKIQKLLDGTYCIGEVRYVFIE